MALNSKSQCPEEATTKAAKFRSIIALGTGLLKEITGGEFRAKKGSYQASIRYLDLL